MEREFATVSPPGNTFGFHATEAVVVKVDRTLKPLVIALGVFGGVALLAAILIAIQLISRQLGDATEDLDVLRAFGADQTALVADGLIGMMASIVVGSLTAAGVAVMLCRPCRPSDRSVPSIPTRGSPSTGPCLASGCWCWWSVLGATATALAFRGTPHRSALRARVTPPTTSKVVRDGGRRSGSRCQPWSGCASPSNGVGVGPRCRCVRPSSAPCWRVTLVVATLTFGSGLQSLVSRPALYGWNFTYLLNASNTTPPKALTLLDRDPDVAAWDGYDYNVAEVDGTRRPVPVRGRALRHQGAHQSTDPHRPRRRRQPVRSSSGPRP